MVDMTSLSFGQICVIFCRHPCLRFAKKLMAFFQYSALVDKACRMLWCLAIIFCTFLHFWGFWPTVKTQVALIHNKITHMLRHKPLSNYYLPVQRDCSVLPLQANVKFMLAYTTLGLKFENLRRFSKSST